MARKRALSVREVDAIKEIGVHWVAPSLYMQVRPQGTRSWLFRWSVNGENHWAGLGACRDVSLSKARDEADRRRLAVHSGADPSPPRQAPQRATKPAVPTFGEAAKAYITSHEAGWRNEKHRAQWHQTIRDYANPRIGKKPIDEISVDDIIAILRPIWTDKPETASRLRGRLERILGWAIAMGHRSDANPAGLEIVRHLLPPIGKVRRIEHHAAVPWPEVPALVAKLLQRDSVSAKALTFTILTAARTGEMIGARWDEIDLDARIWTIPAERTKSEREHRVPLSDAAVAVLESMDGERSDLVFEGSRPGRPLSNMAMLQLLRTIRSDGVTVHGFRSSFRDWCGEQGVPREVAEAALAHVVQNKAEAAYARSDLLERRRPLMDEWARHCTSGHAQALHFDLSKT